MYNFGDHPIKNNNIKRTLIKAYSDPVVRIYCTIRFRIMNIRILEEIGQYLPKSGNIMDIGCGFGLFSHYYALLSPDRRFTCLDISKTRIQTALEVSRKLNLSEHITYYAAPAEHLSEVPGVFQAVYMLDIIHHLRKDSYKVLLHTIYDKLAPHGILILKDIATKPKWKVCFTWLLDMLMNPKSPPHYISIRTLRDQLEQTGFDVKIHELRDILPYPHVLYVCRKDLGLQN
jgi:2-polyprenyl-3-methyl-5-hydroxy-6-metoxy-1,4-benzoquinol methylase